MKFINSNQHALSWDTCCNVKGSAISSVPLVDKISIRSSILQPINLAALRLASSTQKWILERAINHLLLKFKSSWLFWSSLLRPVAVDYLLWKRRYCVTLTIKIQKILINEKVTRIVQTLTLIVTPL